MSAEPPPPYLPPPPPPPPPTAVQYVLVPVASLPPKKESNVVTIVILVVVLFVVSSIVLSAILHVLEGNMLGSPNSPSPVSVSMTAGSAGTCLADGSPDNTFNIGLGGTTHTLVTSDFGLSLTESGRSSSTAPGTASTSASGTCYAFPAPAGWYVLLIPPGSTGSNWAIFSGAGWQQCTGPPAAPCTSLSALPAPVTISGGQTLLLVASPSVNLVQASLAVYGLNGQTVVGSTTL
ncbi:MAG: hypothetical protein KGJ69_06855 [Thermoplasmata archaeon]|nr:hypothetical protein [Thermoplasmata archaeon]